MGAGGARTGGVNRLPPVGLMPFSVGAGGNSLDVVVVVVVVVDVVEGACSPLLPHPAVSTPIATRAPPPTAAIKRRVNEFGSITSELALRQLSTSSVTKFQCNPQRPRTYLPGKVPGRSPGDGEDRVGEFGSADHQVRQQRVGLVVDQR